jgi:polar amino acid transport system permease protein
MAYQWDWSALFDNLPILLSAIGTTVLAAIFSMIGSLILGMPIALLRLSRPRFGWIAYLYIELFRNLPLLVLVFWVFTVLPLVTGLTLDPFTCGVLALTLNLAAFVAEIYRAGITSIGPGQSHAALALGMTRPQLYRRVILPQALARVVPALGNLWGRRTDVRGADGRHRHLSPAGGVHRRCGDLLRACLSTGARHELDV